MGREIRRVPLDFDWPVNKTYEGFKNPYYKYSHQCPECKRGYSQYAEYLHDLWYGNVTFKPEDNGSIPFSFDDEPIAVFAKRNVENSPEYYGTSKDAVVREQLRLADLFNSSWCHHLNADDVKALLDADRIWDFTRRPLPGIPLEEYIKTRAYYLWLEAGCPEGRDLEFWEEAKEEHSRYWLPFDNGYRPTPEEVNRWGIFGFGITCEAHSVIKARCEREDEELLCDECEGAGNYWESEEYEKLAKEWRPEEPPEGEGYQLWETVSEGSPITPVFATAEELATYLSENDIWRSNETSYDNWLKFIQGPGWAPSMVVTNGVLKSGVDAMVE